jgi:activator of HSP90 ATPase
MKSFKVTATINATCDVVYTFFLDSKLHADVTGSPARIEGTVGGKFSAWDAYITGEIVGLIKNKHIVQKWRTTDFSNEDKDSIVEIEILERPDGRSGLTLKHSGLPEGTEAGYKDGWRDYYLKPLKKYFKEKAAGK